MNRRILRQPQRASRRASVRLHVAAALGACAGMLAITLFVVGLHIIR